MAESSFLPRMMRIGAVLVLAAGLVLGFLHIASVLQKHDEQESGLELAINVAGLVFLYGAVGGTLAAVLATAATVLAARTELPRPFLLALRQIDNSFSALRGEMQLLEKSLKEGANRPAPTPAPTPSPLEGGEFRRIVQLLHEVQEITLLNDQQRQERLAMLRQQRKRESLGQIGTVIRLQDFARARNLLETLEQEFPGDGEVEAVRQVLATAMAAAEASVYQRIVARVEEYMGASAWEQALTEASDLVESFPGNPEAPKLLERVTRERAAYREVSAQQLYDLMRRQIEQRQWRAALAAAQKLVNEFPDHRRAMNVAKQLQVLRENAESEQWQEHQQQIEHLLQAKRFNEAIELVDELIRRYPHSPQAEKLEDLLPQLRAMAAEEQTLGSTAQQTPASRKS